MKTLGTLLCLMGLLATAHAEEHLWDNFDTYAIGSIADQPGWSSFPALNTTTGVVDSGANYSPSQSLSLPWHTDDTSAAYTNLGVNGHAASNHAVVRFSAMIYTPNTNTTFQMGLLNTNSGAFLSFLSQGGFGHIGFQDHSAVDVPLITNRFAKVTVLYNRSNDMFRLDYNNTNHLDWTLSGVASGPIEDFHQFVVLRLTNTASTVGDLFVDNVRVETFPPYVTAWWRCADLDGVSNERLGCLKPARRGTYKIEEHFSSSDPAFDGQFDFHNEYSFNRFYTDPATNSISTPRSTNWTTEAVFRTPTNQNMAFLCWGTSRGFDTNGSYVSFGYSDTYNDFYCSLRDAEQTNSQNAFLRLGSFTPDDRWHHVALVKSNTTLSLYLDYQFMAETNLTTLSDGDTADGTYQFTTDSRATVGVTLNGGNSSGIDTRIDEVRFSSRILELHEFLQPGQPMIVEIQNSALDDPWDLLLKLILDRTYRVETSPSLGPGANWQPDGIPFVADDTFNFVAISSAAKTNFVRIIRED